MMQSRKHGSMKVICVRLTFLGVLVAIGSCSPESSPIADEAMYVSYPQTGDATAYGLSLSLNNAATFLQYYEQYSLTPEQEAIKREALTPLLAPCCDDNPMYTCCCPCNLAKSVWGLSARLIVVDGYDAPAVREAALQWLRFIRRDYYKARELEQQGLNPRTFGVYAGKSCYEGRCELPFRQGGCGGMGELIME
jgi:hypothetical protein